MRFIFSSVLFCGLLLSSCNPDVEGSIVRSSSGAVRGVVKGMGQVASAGKEAVNVGKAAVRVGKETVEQTKTAVQDLKNRAAKVSSGVQKIVEGQALIQEGINGSTSSISSKK